jgi:hypothetical protein
MSASWLITYCPSSYAFEMLDACRAVFQTNRNVCDQLFEFRFVTIQDDAPVLFNLPSGEYIVAEAIILE